MKNTAIYYGSTTGTTEDISKRVAEKLECDLFNVAEGFNNITNYKNIIFATSTWGLGELQDDWVSQLDSLRDIDLSDKNITFIGTGDGASFPDTFIDGIGIIYEIIESSGANFIGQVDTSEYDYGASLGEKDGKFFGLAIDEVNESDRTDERIDNWVDGLKKIFG